MFKAGEIVKVLVLNIPNSGYDYFLQKDADVGAFVSVPVMNKIYNGVIIGKGDSNLDKSKIKKIIKVYNLVNLSQPTIEWIFKLSSWNMIEPSLVLKLILNVPSVFNDLKKEKTFILDKKNIKKITQQRQKIIDVFEINKDVPITKEDIKNISGVNNSVILNMIKDKTLIENGYIEKEDFFSIPKYIDTGIITLNTEQKKCADSIDLFNGFNVSVLDGITGSGKTQVYFDSIFKVYSSGKSVLLMMPEIALTTQFIDRFEKRFGEKPIVWHSNLTVNARRNIWLSVLNSKIKIVIGTRSALFLPWQDLGLIVIDEEHDTSYKQEENGIYHARDMAILKSKILNIPIILASATPSIETFNNINLNKYKHLILKTRFAGAKMPEIKTIDMKISKPTKYSLNNKELNGNLSPVLVNEIEEKLKNKEQVLLFINRRGFAPIVACDTCGEIIKCPDCDLSMTYHKNDNNLVCHICGKILPIPKKCPKCDNKLVLRGFGIEKIQEEVKVRFPNAKVQIISSDTAFSAKEAERLISKIEKKEIDIIIGTQILAKGHHFPDLTLIGVVDTDMGLYGNDFRAAEHTFSQIMQVSGRAGRGEKAGKVFLQTYQPENPVIQAICNYDRDRFIESDIAIRKIAKMPPFSQLISIIIEAKKESSLIDYCKNLDNTKPNLINAKILGPVKSQIYKIRSFYRMRFLVIGGVNSNLQPIIKNWVENVKKPTNLKVKFDVNPQSFF